MARDGPSKFYDQPASTGLGAAAMDNQTKGIDGKLVHEDIDLDKVTGLETGKLIIHRGVTAAYTL
jgi:hypothetical protein